MKRLISAILVIIMLVSMVCATEITSVAATSLPNSIYIQQGYPATCTLAASTMMLRSRMYLSGNSAWSSITEDSLLPVAWISGTGLRHSFTYSINGNSMSVAHSYSSGMANSTLKWLLDTHPEGIVLYCGNLPHAVFVTDYEGDTFYCADSAGSPYSGKRLALSSSLLGYHYGSQANILANTTAYWYVSSYNITPGGMSLDLGSDFYALINYQPGWKTIGQDDSGNVELIYESPDTIDRVLWHFVRNSDGSYTIASMLNGFVLDVENASSADRANVQCVNANGSDAQKWYISWNTQNESYYLRAACTSKVMDLDNGDISEGNNIHMYTQSTAVAQRFAISKVTSAHTISYNINSDKENYEFGDTVNLSIGGNLPYVYNYKFYIKDSYGEETVIDNKCNSVLNFTPEKEGIYTVYAQVKNPVYSDTGSYTDRAVTFTVGCPHEFAEKFVEASAENAQGYVLHTCTKCGDSYKDGYATYKDGWYYSAELPKVIENGEYEVEYNNYYEKEQKDSPGSDWTKAEVVKNEWQNVGDQYTTYIQQATSDSRVLVREYYYHWCGPSTGAYANHSSIDSYIHYDEISLPNSSIYITWTGEDEGHPVYTLAYADGSAVYCQSGVSCDGAWGTHSARSKAWYKYYVYQDRERIEIYKYTKESGWISEADLTADSTTYRFKAGEIEYTDILGDSDNDGVVGVLDATVVQRDVAKFSLGIFNERVADVDGDGEITVLDATEIQRYASKLPSVEGIGSAIK